MRKPVRFSLLGHFQRMCPLSPRTYAIENDRFSSWRSLFFYRCTDVISFARLKSQDTSSCAKKISTLPPSPVPQPSTVFDVNSFDTWLTPPDPPVVNAPTSPITPPPVPQQPQVAKSRKKIKGGFRRAPSELQAVKDGWIGTSFGSQVAEPRKTRVYEMPVAAVLPPCSPKSIYVLASLVRQPPTGCIGRDTNTPNQAWNPAPLRQCLCRHQKQSVVGQRRGRGFLVGHCQVRMSPGSSPDANVGLTCSFSQKKIMEMECELLMSNSRDPKMIARVKENIGHIADGSSSYRTGALKLGLKKAFDLKRQERGVLLRCTRNGCPKNTTPASYSSVGSQTYCQDCNYHYGNYYMQCTGCSNTRTSNYASCQSCGKKFM